MSEGSTSSVPAGETTETKPVSTAPEKRSPWLMIIAIVVVLILIGSAAVVLMRPKGATLSVKMSPSSLVLDAGSSQVMAAYPMYGDTNLTGSSEVTYSWSIAPSSLGSFSLYAKQKTNFTAAVIAGNGTVKCTVKYKTLTEVASATVGVLPPYLAQVAVAPSVKTLGHDKSQNFTATAISSVGSSLSGVTFSWGVWGLPIANYTLTVNATTQNATFTSGTKDVVNATLNATAAYRGVTLTGTALITITLKNSVRSVSYLYYDMFNVPFESYWNWRTPEEIPITHSYPYIYTYQVISNDIYYYSDLKQNMTAKNLTSVNTNTDPLFFPQGLLNNFHPLTTGGTMTVDWSMSYPTMAECNTTQWAASLDTNFDGWIVELKGTVTLDKDAALSVLGGGSNGLTSTILDSSFASWWSSVKSEALVNWHSWLNLQGGPAARYDIYPMYGSDIDPLVGSIEAAKVGNNVVLTIDDFSWGMECLMARWIHHAFSPTEWYMYDFNMHAVIGPEVADIEADGACLYVMYAYETSNIPVGQTVGEPCWVFEPCLGDASYSRLNWPGEHSQMDPYNGLSYMNNAPGSGYYGQQMPWDYTPAAFNLSANETLSLKWPAGNITFFLETSSKGIAPVSGPIAVKYGEPIDKDMPTKIKTDNNTRTVTFTGPIDMWNWSKTQTADSDLVDLWANSTFWKLLPQGAPYVEFKINQVPPSYADHMTLSNVTNPVLVNTPTSIKVTVWDQYGQVFTGYTGKVNFTSNRTASTVLPANYTFTTADAGSHVFTGLSFSGLWNYTIHVKDVANPAVNGSISHIMVIPSAQRIDHFAVLGIRSMNAGDRSNVRVIAYDQYGMKFATYHGTVNFSTNATSAYALPANYTFVSSDHGDKNFSIAVSFEERGVYSVTVIDRSDPSANGTQTNIVISSPPRIIYTAYDFFKEPWQEWWYERAKYEVDIVLCNTAGNYTMIYNKDKLLGTGIIYAPYRWNTTAYNLTTLSVNHPEFMPVMGEKNVSGAAVNMTVNWNYLSWAWWNSTLYPEWHTNPGWYPLVDKNGTTPNSTMWAQVGDGYYVADIITAVMNRQAALTWLNLSMSEPNPTLWWNTTITSGPDAGKTNGQNYTKQWLAWIEYEGDTRLDINGGYADHYYDYGTMAVLSVLPNGYIKLSILHFNGGIEVLTVRWLTETEICTHQPYAEDFKMVVNYLADQRTDLTYDEVVQFNFHAVMANGTVGGAAWVWEPQRIDYTWTAGHPSDYYPYYFIYAFGTGYPDYNSGDPNWGHAWGSYGAYEYAPGYFNLTSYETLIFEMPRSNVVGYLGKNVSMAALSNASMPNPTFGDYDNITVHGYLDLGYNVTGPFGTGVDLSTMWDNTTKVLTINGPRQFDQYHWQQVGTYLGIYPIYALNYTCTEGPILHGAPWIEFNVMSGDQVITSKTTSLPSGDATPSVPSTASPDLLALASVVCGTMLAVAALAVGVWRPREVLGHP